MRKLKNNVKMKKLCLLTYILKKFSRKPKIMHKIKSTLLLLNISYTNITQKILKPSKRKLIRESS